MIMNLSEYLLGQGYAVTIITTGKEQEEYELLPGMQRVFSDLTEQEISKNRILNFTHRVKKLRKIIEAQNPQIVISFIGKNNMMAILATLFTQIPVLISVRGDPLMEYDTRAMRFVSKHLFAKADGVILQTKDAKAYFPKKIQKKSVILPNPLNMNFLKQLPEQNRQKRIVTVGRMDQNKNQKLLLDAFYKVQEEFPDWKLYMYGDGPERTKLMSSAMRYKIDQKVMLPGNISDVANQLQKARIFVLPSNTEGMPNSLMEAMALKMAVISTDCPCGGPKTLIKQGENGILIPVGDQEALENALRSVLSDETYEQHLAEKAVKIREELHPDKVNKQWMDYIEKFL